VTFQVGFYFFKWRLYSLQIQEVVKIEDVFDSYYELISFGVIFSIFDVSICLDLAAHKYHIFSLLRAKLYLRDHRFNTVKSVLFIGHFEFSLVGQSKNVYIPTKYFFHLS